MKTISVKVIPNAKKDEVIKKNENTFLIRINAPAEGGRANKKLIDVLSDYFFVSKSSIRIIKGLKSKEKIIELIDD
jgi:uncharacterized protein (TIGR00251 family)